MGAAAAQAEDQLAAVLNRHASRASILIRQHPSARPPADGYPSSSRLDIDPNLSARPPGWPGSNCIVAGSKRPIATPNKIDNKRSASSVGSGNRMSPDATE